MLATQKTCKKPKKPQAIDSETWKTVEAAMCIGGLGYSEAGRKFGIEPHAIMMKAKRHGWALPSMIQKRVEALQKSVTERAVCEGNRACNDQAVEIIAQSWVEKAKRIEPSRSILRTPRFAKPQERACQSRVGATSIWPTKVPGAMLGSMTPIPHVSIGMALINYRLEHIHLPKDALPE